MITWTAHKRPTSFGPKRQWYSAEGVDAVITPRRPMVSCNWGKGHKQSRSRVVYDVRIGKTHRSGFRTVTLAKEFVEEYVAATGPIERGAVVAAWR